ncbi:MAG TPA: hypothetical protein VHK01_17060 [Lacipirellulaceae bacterium]|jgi:hypothetical protein|nr:hypothetical protein [Lacipirellulaceae bacterium]
MQTQHEEPSPSSERPSFFGMPRGARIWVQAGRRFWVGALFGFLNGIGFGLITGVAMVQEWGFITPKNDMRVTGIALVLLIVSIFWAQWAISRGQQK